MNLLQKAGSLLQVLDHQFDEQVDCWAEDGTIQFNIRGYRLQIRQKDLSSHGVREIADKILDQFHHISQYPPPGGALGGVMD